MLRSLIVSVEDLSKWSADELLAQAEAGGYNALHLSNCLDALPQALLDAAERRDIALHCQVSLDFGCPSQPHVQDRSIEHCVTAATSYPWTSIQVLRFGFPGVGSLDPVVPDLHFYRSICFCPACQYGYGAAGSILEYVAQEAIEALTANPNTVVSKHPTVDTMLLWRRSVQYGLLRQIREAVRTPLCLHTAADLRYTGDCSSLLFDEAQGLVDSCSTSLTPEQLAPLGRPMPIYRMLLTPTDIDAAQDPIYSGYIQATSSL